MVKDPRHHPPRATTQMTRSSGKSAYQGKPLTVSFHNFKSQNLKLSVSNPYSKYVAYVSVLSQISNCQSQGRKNKHDILKTDRTGSNETWDASCWFAAPQSSRYCGRFSRPANQRISRYGAFPENSVTPVATQILYDSVFRRSVGSR